MTNDWIIPLPYTMTGMYSPQEQGEVYTNAWPIASFANASQRAPFHSQKVSSLKE